MKISQRYHWSPVTFDNVNPACMEVNTEFLLFILDFHIGDEAVDRAGYATKVILCRYLM